MHAIEGSIKDGLRQPVPAITSVPGALFISGGTATLVRVTKFGALHGNRAEQ